MSCDIPIPQKLEGVNDNEWKVGYRFFFEDLQRSKKLIFLSRIPSLVATLILIFIVFYFINARWGWGAALSGALILAFDPLILSNGALALNDIFVTLFSLAGFILLFEFIEGRKWAVYGSGIAIGLAITSKLSGVLLLPLFIGILVAKKKKLKVMITLFLSMALTVLVIYRFNVSDILELFTQYGRVRNSAGTEGLLFIPVSGYATIFFYPIALLLKTPLSILILWIFSIYSLNKKKKNKFIYLSLLSGAALFLGAAMISPNHFGVRYVLPGVGFMAILIGIGYSHIKKKKERLVWWGVIGILILETLILHPHHMSYVNWIVGGPKEGYKWLDGSNQDWGQDLPALKKYMEKNNNPSVLLSFIGSGHPMAWGVQAQDLFSPSFSVYGIKKYLNPIDSDKELLAISARILAFPNLNRVFHWLKDKKPTDIVGNTILIYDVSNDVEAALQVAKIYEWMGRPSYAERQYKRAQYLNPNVSLTTP